MKVAKKRKNPFEGDDGLELIFIDPNEHIFEGQAVIGPAPLEFYQDVVIKSIVAQAIKKLKPKISEKNGYEVVSYKVIVKGYDK